MLAIKPRKSQIIAIFLFKQLKALCILEIRLYSILNILRKVVADLRKEYNTNHQHLKLR